MDLQLPVQSVPITTKVVSSNPVHGEVYSIEHDVIKFISDLQQVDGFLRVLWSPPPIVFLFLLPWRSSYQEREGWNPINPFLRSRMKSDHYIPVNWYDGINFE